MFSGFAVSVVRVKGELQIVWPEGGERERQTDRQKFRS